MTDTANRLVPVEGDFDADHALGESPPTNSASL